MEMAKTSSKYTRESAIAPDDAPLDAEAGGETEQEQALPTVPISKLFRFRDEKDSLAIGCACVFALLQGCSMPCFTIILGDATDAMGGEEDGTYAKEMREPLFSMVYLMVFIFVTASSHAWLFEWSSQRQGASSVDQRRRHVLRKGRPAPKL